MQLSNYRIRKEEGSRIIDFGDVTLNYTIGHFLNGNAYTIDLIDHYLDELCYLRDNWSDIDIIVDEHHNGYFDTEVLQNLNLTGSWFSLLEYDDIWIIVGKSDRRLFIGNPLEENEPRTEISLDDLVDVLEQWKQIIYLNIRR